MDKPCIAITMGDINGIGPEVLAKALACPDIQAACRPLVFGCTQVYREVCSTMTGSVTAHIVDSTSDISPLDRAVSFAESPYHSMQRDPGEISTEAGRAAMKWLDAAVDSVQNGRCRALVTGPIHKEGIHAAGYRAAGHTDYLAERTGTESYRMCLFTEHFGVVHNTGHMSLVNALELITPQRLEESIHMGWDVARQLGIAQPRIAVAGLNPHAGENGAFGNEERDRIVPALDACRAGGIPCVGPVSPDAIFRQAWERQYDIVIALYHDQGHIPMKMVARDQAVNVTLGLPFVRTSVDHGTAYDIAGTGTANEGSLIAAILMALRLSQTEQESSTLCAQA